MTMNTKNLTSKTPATTKSARVPANRQEKTAAARTKPSVPAASGGNAPVASAPAPATITLAPSFLALADQFGMVPERLAERVISAFTETRPARIVVKARASSGQAGH